MPTGRVAAGAAAVLVACACVAAPRCAAAAGFSNPQQQDLWYIAYELETFPQSSLLIHPGELPRFKAYAKGIIAQAASPLPEWRYLLLANDLVQWFDDVHTNILGTLLAPAVLHRDALPLVFYWTADGLVAIPTSSTPSLLHLGDEVLAIGGLSVLQLQAELRRFIPGSLYGKEQIAARLLSTGVFLRWLGVVSAGGRIAMRLERADGRRYDVTLQLAAPTDLQPYLQASTAFKNAFLAALPHWTASSTAGEYRWGIDPAGHYAVMQLMECVDNSFLWSGMHAFFQAVAARGVPNVVLDLRGNPGGYYSIIGDLLQYLPHPSPLLWYGNAMPVPESGTVPAPVFHGHLYVLIDGGTASAAVMTADTLRANHLATLVGTPTGEAPDLRTAMDFQAPATGLAGEASVGSILLAPAQSEAGALAPDVGLPLTVQDVRQGVNPVARWLAGLQ